MPNIWDNKNVAVPQRAKKKLSKIEVWNYVIAIALMLYGISPLGRTIFIFDIQQNVFVFYLALVLPIIHIMAGFGLLCRSVVGYRLLLACSLWNAFCTYIPCKALIETFLYSDTIPHFEEIKGILIVMCGGMLLQLCIVWFLLYIFYQKTLKKLYPNKRFHPLKPQKDVFDKIFDSAGRLL